MGLTEYELDLFGRVRSLKQQALQEYLATTEARRAAQISLIAEVANSYLDLLANRELLALANQDLKIRNEAMRILNRRYEVGTISQLDLRRGETLVATVQADIALHTRLSARSRNALQALVGAPLPDTLLAGESLESPKFAARPSTGLDSELLLRRPDVLAAEHQLKAANANIGAARAAFFPRISLIGSYGTISTDLSGLFSAGSTAWSFTPQLSLPIFEGGRNRAELDVAQVSKKIEVANYQSAIQTAFREVADALAGLGTLEDELSARRSLVKSGKISFELSVKRYQYGADTFFAVLDAQRTYYQVRQDLIELQLAELTNTVNLYKVLGGGWREHAVDAEEAQTDSATPPELSFWSRLSSYLPARD